MSTLDPSNPFQRAVIISALSRRERRLRELHAELVVLTTFDALRQAAGHDYGAGQRGAEIARRTRELHESPHPAEPYPDNDELAAAFERVGSPRIARIAREDYRRSSPATRRTRATWARVERLFRSPAKMSTEAIVDELAARADALVSNGRALPESNEGFARRSALTRELDRRRDDERAVAENDEQRDYAEERFNAELMHEV